MTLRSCAARANKSAWLLATPPGMRCWWCFCSWISLPRRPGPACDLDLQARGSVVGWWGVLEVRACVRACARAKGTGVEQAA